MRVVHFAQVVLGGGNAPGVGPCFRDAEHYWCQNIIGVSSFFNEKRTDTNNPNVRMSGPNLPGQLMQLLGLSQLDT